MLGGRLEVVCFLTSFFLINLKMFVTRIIAGDLFFLRIMVAKEIQIKIKNSHWQMEREVISGLAMLSIILGDQYRTLKKIEIT